MAGLGPAPGADCDPKRLFPSNTRRHGETRGVGGGTPAFISVTQGDPGGSPRPEPGRDYTVGSVGILAPAAWELPLAFKVYFRNQASRALRKAHQGGSEELTHSPGPPEPFSSRNVGGTFLQQDVYSFGFGEGVPPGKGDRTV